jgi:hypothetical protein
MKFLCCARLSSYSCIYVVWGGHVLSTIVHSILLQILCKYDGLLDHTKCLSFFFFFVKIIWQMMLYCYPKEVNVSCLSSLFYIDNTVKLHLWQYGDFWMQPQLPHGLIFVNSGASKGCLPWSIASSFRKISRARGIRREGNDG